MPIDITKIRQNSIKIKDRNFSHIDSTYLKQFRTSLGLSEATLADYLGVTKETIKKWEHGKTKISPTAARLIFLFKQDPRILSLIKEISIADKPLNFVNND